MYHNHNTSLSHKYSGVFHICQSFNNNSRNTHHLKVITRWKQRVSQHHTLLDTPAKTCLRTCNSSSEPLLIPRSCVTTPSTMPCMRVEYQFMVYSTFVSERHSNYFPFLTLSYPFCFAGPSTSQVCSNQHLPLYTPRTTP
jgi:hypothetical protein